MIMYVVLCFVREMEKSVSFTSGSIHFSLLLYCTTAALPSPTYTDHCLHYLLPEELNRSVNLRHRGHEYTLSHIRTTQHKNIPLSIDVYLAWSSTLCFIVCLFYTSH